MKKIYFWCPEGFEVIIRDNDLENKDSFTDFIKELLYNNAAGIRSLILSGSTKKNGVTIPVSEAILNKKNLTHIEPEKIPHPEDHVLMSVTVGKNTYKHLEYMAKVGIIMTEKAFSFEQIISDMIFQNLAQKVTTISKTEFENEK